MKAFITAAAISSAALQPATATADECLDRFVKILTDVSEKGPVKIRVTQQYKGAPAMENMHYSLNSGHWMTKMLKPASAPWSLGYRSVLYTSTDRGKTWKKARVMQGQSPQAKLKALQENAKTARNARCGQETLDGAAFDTVEGDYTHQQGMKIEYHNKYWIRKDDGFIRKAVYTFKARNISGRTTQLINKAPDLTLPRPE